MEKSGYISSKTNILWSYFMLSSPSLIPNHIMIHHNFLLAFFSFLMNEFFEFVLCLPLKYNGNNE